MFAPLWKFEMFKAADHKPFGHPASPYDYPCFDLDTGETEGQQEALLAVDIHT